MHSWWLNRPSWSSLGNKTAVMMRRASFRVTRRWQAQIWEEGTSTLGDMAFMPDKRASR